MLLFLLNIKKNVKNTNCNIKNDSYLTLVNSTSKQLNEEFMKKRDEFFEPSKSSDKLTLEINEKLQTKNNESKNKDESLPLIKYVEEIKHYNNKEN